MFAEKESKEYKRLMSKKVFNATIQDHFDANIFIYAIITFVFNLTILADCVNALVFNGLDQGLRKEAQFETFVRVLTPTVYTIVVTLLTFFAYRFSPKCFCTFSFLVAAQPFLVLFQLFNPYYDYAMSPTREKVLSASKYTSIVVILMLPFFVLNSIYCAVVLFKMSCMKLKVYNGDDVYDVIYGGEDTCTKKLLS
ncbi:unnamed protein product [Caenorhabditis sp. 36 PRJEB53466]|nr:unnamed protein product [Caenorhabditis sp. 36 PRJEB53466]